MQLNVLSNDHECLDATLAFSILLNICCALILSPVVLFLSSSYCLVLPCNAIFSEDTTLKLW